MATNNVLIMSWGMPQIMRLTERGLKAMGYHSTTVFRGPTGGPGNTWVDQGVQYIEKHKPHYLFSWQRLYGQARPIWLAARKHGVQSIIMDFGLWPHYMTAFYDPKGENRGSALVGNFDALMEDPVQLAAAREKRGAVEHMGKTLEQSAADVRHVMPKTGMAALPPERDFVFLALQRCAHGRPDKVLELDAVPSRRDPGKIAKDVIQECERQNKFVVIKQHPQGFDIAAMVPRRGPHHYLMPRFSGRPENETVFAWCLANMSHLVTVNSTTWSLALAMGKPVSVLGRGWYSFNGIVNECKLVADAIPPPEPSIERGKRFVALMLSRQLRLEECRNHNRLRRVLNRIYPGQF